jgi:hypothetical protein
MRDRIRAVSSRLGASADDRRVIEWVDWAFEQKQGRAAQLTPMLPMQAYTPDPADPTPSATPTPTPTPIPTPARLPPAPQRNIALIVGLVVLMLVVLGGLAWTLAR